MKAENYSHVDLLEIAPTCEIFDSNANKPTKKLADVDFSKDISLRTNTQKITSIWKIMYKKIIF